MSTDPIGTIPANINNLYNDKFKFVIQSLPTVQFFCSSANLPGVSLEIMRMPSPVNDYFVGGKKLAYDGLELQFRVDEDLANWIEIFNWVVGITGPQTPTQFQTFTTSKQLTSKPGYNIFSDATLFSLTNSSNPNIKIFFKNIFPYSVSGLPLDITDSEVAVATVSFRYNYYEFVKD